MRQRKRKGAAMKRIGRKNGFTVVELAIVLVIIGIVFAIAAPSITGYIANAQARNCKALTHNLFSELKSVITVGRLDVDEISDYEQKISEQIETTVERCTVAEETAVYSGGAYSITTDKICDAGTHTVSWSFSAGTETDSSVTVSAKIECKCSVHENEDLIYNGDIIFDKPAEEGGGEGGGTASGNYSEVMARLDKLIIDNWSSYDISGKQPIDKKLSYGIGKIADDIAADPLLSQYFTKEDVMAFLGSEYAKKIHAFSKYNIINFFVGDYLFNTVLNPTFTYTDKDGVVTVYNYKVRIGKDIIENPEEFVYYVNENGTSQPNYANFARFLCYRTESGGKYTETWYRYTAKKQMNLPGAVHGIKPDSQSAVNQLIDKHPELFELVG